MSVKVPSPSVSYQSHNHCQCDFCCSRRTVNAKKWAVSQYARQLRHAKLLHGQPYDRVSEADAADCARAYGTATPTTFRADVPEPVDQMARNAQRGRGGARATLTAAASAAGKQPHEQQQQQQRDADEAATMRDLDKLERLLMLEHKARVQAALEADKLATLRTTGQRAAPLQPLPADDEATSTTAAWPRQDDNDDASGAPQHADDVDIHGAFVRAHHCPVPPPPQCAASARLQDTLNDLRLVTSDPANVHNRAALQRVLEVQAREDALARGDAAARGGAGGGAHTLPCAGYAYATRAMRRAKEEQEARQQQRQQRDATDTAARRPQQTRLGDAPNGFGDTMAAIRTSASHPQGAGVVWRNAPPAATASTTTAAAAATRSDGNGTAQRGCATPLPPGAAAALAMQQANAATLTRSRHATS